jgi:two-component system, NarL family, response regulator NreC
MNTFRILLVDDHPIFLLGVRSLLESHETWEVCGEAGDGRDAVEKCRQLKPDLVVLDIGMPRLNGMDAARQILRNNPHQRILVLTDVDSEQVIRECLEAGVRGWVFKADGALDLIAAVLALEQGRSMFSSRVSDLVLDGYLRRPHVDSAVAMPRALAPREREVVQLVAEGKSSKEIAVMLGLSVKTVETHRSNILIKLKIHSIVELVMYAVRNGIVSVRTPVAVMPDAHSGNGHAVIGMPA